MKIFITIAFISVINYSYSQINFKKDFENGNGKLISYDKQKNTIIFKAENDSVNTENVWFYFNVAGYRTDTILTFKEIFHKDIETPNNPVYSHDNKNFFHSFSYKHDTISTFFIKYPSENIFVASGLPYTDSDFKKFLGSINNNKYLKTDTLNNGATLLTISDFSKNNNKQLIWVIARQHAFESISSIATQGFINYLLNGDYDKQILKKYIFKIVPITDINSVEKGMSGRMQLPRDFNRDWNNPQTETIKQIENEIKNSAENNNYKYFIDFHGTFPGGLGTNDTEFCLVHQNKRQRNNLEYFVNKLINNRMDSDIFIDFGINNNAMTADTWHDRNFPEIEFATTVELNWYNFDKGPISFDQYLEMGATIARTLIEL